MKLTKNGDMYNNWVQSNQDHALYYSQINTLLTPTRAHTHTHTHISVVLPKNLPRAYDQFIVYNRKVMISNVLKDCVCFPLCPH